AELVEARADDAAGGLQLARDEQAHGHRRRVPAARGKAAENRSARGGVIQMKGLRVELGREALDARRVHAHALGAAELLSRCEILEIAHAAADYTPRHCYTKTGRIHEKTHRRLQRFQGRAAAPGS